MCILSTRRTSTVTNAGGFAHRYLCKLSLMQLFLVAAFLRGPPIRLLATLEAIRVAGTVRLLIQDNTV